MKLLITTSFSTTEIDVNDENKSVILGQIRKCMREHSELQIDTCSGARTFIFSPDVVASAVFELK